jgi:hypothetical protein
VLPLLFLVPVAFILPLPFFELSTFFKLPQVAHLLFLVISPFLLPPASETVVPSFVSRRLTVFGLALVVVLFVLPPPILLNSFSDLIFKLELAHFPPLSVIVLLLFPPQMLLLPTPLPADVKPVMIPFVLLCALFLLVLEHNLLLPLLALPLSRHLLFLILGISPWLSAFVILVPPPRFPLLSAQQLLPRTLPFPFYGEFPIVVLVF